MFGLDGSDTLPVGQYLSDGQELIIGTLKFIVLHTPGHTPGSVCFSLIDQQNWLFSGDTLFCQSVGRTDLWGGSFDSLIKSIKDRLFTLEDDTCVIPGHGPNTSICQEKKSNPFVGI